MSSPSLEAEAKIKIGKSKDNKRDIFERFVLFMAVIEPFSTLPQVYQVWIKSETAGVSLITWILYTVSECIWLAYGLRKKDKALIYGSLSWGILELSVAIGLIVKLK